MTTTNQNTLLNTLDLGTVQADLGLLTGLVQLDLVGTQCKSSTTDT